MFRKEHRLAWLFLILSALTLAAVITTIALKARNTGSGYRIPEVSEGQTAKQAFAAIQRWATEGHPEARLINCTVSQFKEPLTVSGWTFQMYEAESHNFAAVRVDGREVTVLKESPALWEPMVLPVDRWQLDSSEALEIWWNQGGQQVWGEADVHAVHLRLGRDSADNLTWQITVTRRSTTAMDFWEISAETGEVLEYMTGGNDL